MISNKDTENILREILKNKGFKLNNGPRLHGELGVDIHAVLNDEIFLIEVIGYKKSGPARAKDFFEVFFRTISRITEDMASLVIAMPLKWEKGLEIRCKKNYLYAWRRISKAFPELNIWLIDIEKKSIKMTKWEDWN